MMNNGVQITKLEKFLCQLRFLVIPSRFLFFHDEADMLNKSDDISEITTQSISISHRKWVGLFDILEKFCIPINRFWVSATPENCSSIARITGSDIIVLPRGRNYVGVNAWSEWDGVCEISVKNEVERIRELKNGEVILYCADKTNITQNSSAKNLSLKYNCVTCSFNMKRAVVYKNGVIVTGLIDKKDGIDIILEKTRKLCIGFPMIVVGFVLMNRGVSFVATGSLPPTATVMFYSGSAGSHIVGIAQRFGRICGTSRFDLPVRKIYCSDSVREDYIGYLQNQSKVWEALSSTANRGKTICEILSECSDVNLLSRPLDRKVLRKVNSDYSDSCSSGSDVESDADVNLSVDLDLDKMHRLVKSWKGSKGGKVGAMFREMISRGGKMESATVREKLPKTNYDATTNSNTSLKWSLIFKKDGRYHYIRDEALEYYRSL
jgi:hypothetical protein